MRFIQVGVGGFGHVWVDCLKQAPDVDVVGLVDINDEALEKACETGGYPRSICYHSLDDVLGHVQADALVCVTPPELHRDAVVKGLQAGLHVISEKPMAASLADCKAMLAAAKETGMVYAVSQNYRYSPEMWTLAQIIGSDDLGDVGQVKLDFFKGVDFGGGFRHEMEYPLIVDMSIHHFDLMRFITGLNPLRVSGRSWNPSWSNYRGDCSSTALFEMDNGAHILYNGSWCSKGSFSDWNGNWQVECEKGTVIYHNGTITVHRVPDLYDNTDTVSVPLQAPPRQRQDYVLHDFMEAIQSGRKPATDVTDNIHSVAMVFATVNAMKSEQTVEVLDKETRQLLGV